MDDIIIYYKLIESFIFAYLIINPKGRQNMKKKLVTLVICTLMFVTVFTVTATKTTDVSPYISSGVKSSDPNRDPWDLLFEYDIGATGVTGANGNAGAEFDGTYLYSTRWAANLIHSYNIDGSLNEEFSIPGVSGLRDLAYDGAQYMYGGAAGGTIWKMDFTTHTLAQTLTGSFASRAIAYDTDLDVLYVSNWGDPVWVVDPSTGSILDQFNLVTTISTYGFAYDPDPSGPYLWVFDQTTGATSTVYQWDLTAGAYTGFSYNVGLDVGSGIGIAGGLWASPDFEAGLFVLGGCVQDSSAPGVTDFLFGYELYSTGPVNQPPETPAEPTGPDNGVTNVEYDFMAVTSDPEVNQIYYWFDWDDGTNSGWLGPYASGTSVTASHEWDAGGSYDVTVKAKDELGAESGVSPAHTIAIAAGPVLQIENITGGLFKVKATITNNGGSAATDIDWKITLTGGLILLGKETTGNILSLDSGDSREISSKTIIGLGKTLITITATVPEGSATEEQEATVLLFFIKI
jgi:hypothetical protein